MKAPTEPVAKKVTVTALTTPVVPQTLSDYPVTIVGLELLAVWVAVCIVISGFIMSSARMALLTIAAMICSLTFGYGVAALLNPLDQTEANRFPRIVTALGGVASGFTLAKAGDIVTFIGARLPPGPGDFVDTVFLAIGPLSTFLVGLIAGFVVRTAQIGLAENKRLVALQVARDAAKGM